MEIKLTSSDSMKKIVSEILKMKGFSFNEEAETVFIENDSILPSKSGIFVVFNSQDLNSLMNFLDSFGNSKSVEEDKERRTIIGKIDDKYEIIPYEKVVYFEGDGNYVNCKTFENKYKIKEKLYELDEKLDKKMFIRVSKSYIVNILNVGEIVPWFSGRLLLKFNNMKENIEVSRSFVKEFKEFLGL